MYVYLRTFAIRNTDRYRKGRDAEHRLWEDAQIRVPFAELRPSGEARYSFEFAAPESVLVSENAVRTALPFGESIISIEIILTMPSVCKRCQF